MTIAPNAAAAEFDAAARTYRETVERSVKFSGRGLDFFTRAKVRHLVELGERLVGDLSNRTVIDVGCGNGETDRLLSPHIGSLHGVDVSDEMVAEARRRNPEATYQRYDGAILPYDDRTFDITFAICVMHHVPPVFWTDFAGELLRVTRPGGAVMVFEHNPLNPLTRRAVRNCPFDAEAVLLRTSVAARALRDAGATIVARRYILFTPLESRTAARAELLIRRVPFGAQYAVAARPVRVGVRSAG